MVFVEPPNIAELECLVCQGRMPALAKFCGRCGAPRDIALGQNKPPTT